MDSEPESGRYSDHVVGRKNKILIMSSKRLTVH